MLNTNDVFFQHRSRNRRGKVRRPQGFENIGQSTPIPKANRQREDRLLARINELSTLDQSVNSEAQKLLKSLGRRRLRLLNRDARFAKAPSLTFIQKEV